MKFTTKLLSGLALALAFSNAAQAGTVEYNYINSDGKNSFTANFSIDDSKATYNLVSGTFAANGTSYTASSTTSQGFVDASLLNNNFYTFTGYKYSFLSDDGLWMFSISNYVETKLSNGKQTTVASVSISSLANRLNSTTIKGAGTLTKVTAPSATAVPEPEAYAMMLAGLGLVGFAARRKQQAA